MATARIALITSDHRRHRWVAARLASAAELGIVVAESKPAGSAGTGDEVDPAVRRYFDERRAAEEHWFPDAPSHEDVAARTLRLPWQGVNTPEAFEALDAADPEIVFLFGSCIVREPVLHRFAGRIVNMHLGLSPYYRGSATNFWPLVDGLPECVGVTVHHATLRVDGGAIIAQARPAAAADDDSHALGCKAVIAGTGLFRRIAEAATVPPGIRQQPGGRLCRRKDFSPEALRRMRDNFEQGMMPRYLREKQIRDRRFLIQASLPI